MAWKNHKPTIAVTLGDPKGIGPEVVRKALKDPKIRILADWKIFGHPGARGMGNKEAGNVSWEALNEAVEAIKNGMCDGLVTAPVSKSHLVLAGFPFPGQTEFLAHAFQVSRTVMMMVASKLKVALVTIHVPLSEIFSRLTPQRIVETIIITDKALRTDFGIKKPRIAVCGLNPHSGEGGLFGNEEKKNILPAIRQARSKRINATGPFPPDSIFYQTLRGRFDAIVCHYHDQGLIPFKTLFFHEGVNVTLGLPVIRTSPDHGCAFDIAGKGIAEATSMKEAMKLAVILWKERRQKKLREFHKGLCALQEPLLN